MCYEKIRKAEKLYIFDWSYFLGRNFFGNDDFQKLLVYQATFSRLKKANNEYSSSVWKWKGTYSFELRALHDLTSIIKYFGDKIGLQFKIAF